MQTIPSRTFSAMLQYLRGGGMNHIIPSNIQHELPKILNEYLWGDGQVKPKATHSAWLSEDTALKALHNCGYWRDDAPTSWPEPPRIPDKAENDLINEVILEMRRAKTHNLPNGSVIKWPEGGVLDSSWQRLHDETAKTEWWRGKEAHSVGGIEEKQWKEFAKRDLQLDRQAGIETLVALSEAELQQAILEGRRRYKEKEKHS